MSFAQAEAADAQTNKRNIQSKQSNINITKNIIIEPNVILETEELNSLKYNCTNYNYASLLMSNSEISSLCGSQDYKLRSVLTPPFNNNQQDSNLNSQPNAIIHPNPNNGSFIITFNSDYLESYNIDIFSLTGQLIHSELYNPNIGNNLKTIDLKDVIDGLYIVRLTAQNGSYSKNIRIVVNHD